MIGLIGLRISQLYKRAVSQGRQDLKEVIAMPINRGHSKAVNEVKHMAEDAMKNCKLLTMKKYLATRNTINYAMSPSFSQLSRGLLALDASHKDGRRDRAYLLRPGTYLNAL